MLLFLLPVTASCAVIVALICTYMGRTRVLFYDVLFLYLIFPGTVQANNKDARPPDVSNSIANYLKCVSFEKDNLSNNVNKNYMVYI